MNSSIWFKNWAFRELVNEPTLDEIRKTFREMHFSDYSVESTSAPGWYFLYTYSKTPKNPPE